MRLLVQNSKNDITEAKMSVKQVTVTILGRRGFA